MLLSEGYQWLFLHFDYKDIAPTMTHLCQSIHIHKRESRCNQGRSITAAEKPSQHEFIKVKEKSAQQCYQKRNWDTHKPLLSQPANLHPYKPCHGCELSLTKQHCLVPPAVLHPKGDLLHDAAKCSGCKMG